MTKIVDINLLVRYFTGDDPGKADRVERLFRDAAMSAEKLLITDVCLAELVWTLFSYYGVSRIGIADRLVALLNTPGLEFSNVGILLDTSERYRNTNVDYIDAYQAATAVASGVDVYSYDRDFDKFEDVTRLEP